MVTQELSGEAENNLLLMDMFRKMVRIRHFEQTAYDLYTAGRLPGFMHISIGQEATAVGACSALRRDDYMASTHRGHGDTLAKGVPVEAAMAEIFGKETGACRGKGGSLHIADFSQGNLGANGIVAAGIPIATGAALSAKKRGKGQVALAFFGDGAIGAGPTHEALNMASLWHLPAIYVCENNQYAESTPTRESVGIPDIVAWAASYGVAACRVDGNRVTDVYEAARSRRGPGACGRWPQLHRLRDISHLRPQHRRPRVLAGHRGNREMEGERSSRVVQSSAHKDLSIRDGFSGCRRCRGAGPSPGCGRRRRSGRHSGA